jgi:hypothetical protein
MDTDRTFLRGALWSKMSKGDKGRIRQLSVHHTANKKISVNTVGRRTREVSLEMLAQSGLIGADLEDPHCSKFFTGLVERQADVVTFVQTLPDLRNSVLVILNNCKLQLRQDI